MLKLFGIDNSTIPVEGINGLVLLPILFVILIVIIIKNKNTSAAIIAWKFAFAIYLALFIEIVFFPIPFNLYEVDALRLDQGAFWEYPRYNYYPFYGIDADNRAEILRNWFGNALLTFPLGIFVIRLSKYFRSFFRFFILLACICLFIELIQFIGSFLIFNASWRIVDIDDFMFNVAGGILGWMFARIINDFQVKYYVNNIRKK